MVEHRIQKPQSSKQKRSEGGNRAGAQQTVADHIRHQKEVRTNTERKRHHTDQEKPGRHAEKQITYLIRLCFPVNHGSPRMIDRALPHDSARFFAPPLRFTTKARSGEAYGDSPSPNIRLLRWQNGASNACLMHAFSHMCGQVQTEVTS